MYPNIWKICHLCQSPKLGKEKLAACAIYIIIIYPTTEWPRPLKSHLSLLLSFPSYVYEYNKNYRLLCRWPHFEINFWSIFMIIWNGPKFDPELVSSYPSFFFAHNFKCFFHVSDPKETFLICSYRKVRFYEDIKEKFRYIDL